MLATLLIVAAAIAAAPPATAECTLHRDGNKWAGSCGTLIEGEATTLSVAPAAAIVSGVWRRDGKPTSVWAGTIVAGAYPPTPVELEIYGDRRGALRTVFGWFDVARFVRRSRGLAFTVDASHEVAPSGVDRAIVERARRLLDSDTVWNRADNRKCPADATTWSIYCAMEKATIDVSGAFHHRRPALQVVRVIVDERTQGRPYDHRLMDYNNDPTTTLADVQSLFAEALKRIDAAQAK